MFFLPKKHLPQRNLYTQTAHRSFYRPTFWHAETLPRAVFTQQKLFRTEAFTQKKNMHSSFHRQTVFTQKVLRTEVLRTEGFTHSIFYIQTLFTHRCLYTDTNCTQKLVHTARVYTQPTFTQRGFASSSWSPTFCVPPSQVILVDECWCRIISHNIGVGCLVVGCRIATYCHCQGCMTFFHPLTLRRTKLRRQCAALCCPDI